jgi:hypothetical protein
MKAWTKSQRSTIVAIYGMIVGSFFFWQAFNVVLPHALEKGSASPGVVGVGEFRLFAGLVVFGAVVSMPTIAIQALGKVYEWWRAFRGQPLEPQDP